MHCLVRLITILLTFAALCAHAQNFPERPIALVVPSSAGAGAGNLMGRSLAIKLGEKLRQAVVVENKAEADATTGTGYVAIAKPDGYTLLQGCMSLIVRPLTCLLTVKRHKELYRAEVDRNEQVGS